MIFKLFKRNEEKELALVVYRAWHIGYLNIKYLVEAKAFEEIQEKYMESSYELEKMRIAMNFKARNEAVKIWRAVVKSLSPELKKKVLKVRQHAKKV